MQWTPRLRHRERGTKALVAFGRRQIPRHLQLTKAVAVFIPHREVEVLVNAAEVELLVHHKWSVRPVRKVSFVEIDETKAEIDQKGHSSDRERWRTRAFDSAAHGKLTLHRGQLVARKKWLVSRGKPGYGENHENSGPRISALSVQDCPRLSRAQERRDCVPIQMSSRVVPSH